MTAFLFLVVSYVLVFVWMWVRVCLLMERVSELEEKIKLITRP